MSMGDIVRAPILPRAQGSNLIQPPGPAVVANQDQSLRLIPVILPAGQQYSAPLAVAGDYFFVGHIDPFWVPIGIKPDTGTFCSYRRRQGFTGNFNSLLVKNPFILGELPAPSQIAGSRIPYQVTVWLYTGYGKLLAQETVEPDTITIGSGIQTLTHGEANVYSAPNELNLVDGQRVIQREVIVSNLDASNTIYVTQNDGAHGVTATVMGAVAAGQMQHFRTTQAIGFTNPAVSADVNIIVGQIMSFLPFVIDS